MLTWIFLLLPLQLSSSVLYCPVFFTSPDCSFLFSWLSQALLWGHRFPWSLLIGRFICLFTYLFIYVNTSGTIQTISFSSFSKNPGLFQVYSTELFNSLKKAVVLRKLLICFLKKTGLLLPFSILPFFVGNWPFPWLLLHPKPSFSPSHNFPLSWSYQRPCHSWQLHYFCNVDRKLSAFFTPSTIFHLHFP